MANDNIHQAIIEKILGNSTRIYFLKDESRVKDSGLISHGGIDETFNSDLFSYGGIDGTFKIVDLSSLPNDLSKRSLEAKLKEMGDTMPVLCIAKYQCKSREFGDFKLDILSPNGEILLSMERKKRLGLLWLADGDTEIPVHLSDGTIASILRLNKGGSGVEIDVAGEDGLYFKRWIPAWQAQTKWLLCAFLCFLPTFGLGGCFGFYKALKSDRIVNLTKNHHETMVDLEASIFNVISFEGASTWKEKVTLLSLGAYMLTDTLTDKPVSHHHSSPSM